MSESNLILNEALSFREAFDKLSNEHSDDESFVDQVTNSLEEHQLLSCEKIKKDYAKNAESERLLKIGIVGAVKAGKSSLLNALFFDGVDILPKAATPMTAALTEISYGETCEVIVDFFTDSDIQALKERSSQYERELERLTNENLEKNKTAWLKNQKRKNPSFTGEANSEQQNTWKSNAHNMAKRKLDENLSLAGAHEQYQNIKKVSDNLKTESEHFNVKRIEEIAGRLDDYVGSSGKYMPFTSKVTIKLPIDALQGISVIDTPGFNDPVPSRDERARLALRECDVVLILSPARQFISVNDKDVMQKVKTKNGIRELYLIASQVDNQLFNMEITDEAQGNLDMAVGMIKNTLITVAKKNLVDINFEGVFDELIREPDKRLFLSSGICESMHKTFDKKDSWDSGRQKVWENLTKYYPDYFSNSDPQTSATSLKSLGNIEVIDSCLQKVKENKKEIFQQRLEDFGKKYKTAANSVKAELLEYLDNKEKQLKEKNISQIEKEIAQTNRLYQVLAPELDDALEDTVREWYDVVRNDYSSSLSASKDEAKSGVSSAEGSYTRTWTTRGGFLWLRKDYHSEEVTTANATQIKSSIDDFIDDFNENIPYFLDNEIYRLTKKIMIAVQRVWQENNEGGSDSLIEIRNKVRSVISKLELHYDIKYTGKRFSYSSGKLTGYQAEECLSEATAFVGRLNHKFREILSDAMNDLLARCKACNFSQQVLDSYIKKLEQRKKDLEEPKLALENIKRIREEIKKIEC